MPASQIFDSAYQLNGAPTSGTPINLSTKVSASVTVTDTSNGTGDNIGILGDVGTPASDPKLGDAMSVAGLNNGTAYYWGTASVGNVTGIVIHDPQGHNYYFLSNANTTQFNGTTSITPAISNNTTTTNDWALAGNTTPDAPVITSVTDNAQSPTESVAANGSSNDSTPTINGTAGAALTINVYDNGTLLGTTTSAADGTWSYTPTTRTDGSYSFTATATNPALSTNTTSGPSGGYAVSVDTTAATVSGVAYGPNDGALAANKFVTLIVTFNENVFVAGGTPTLALSNGASATYTSGSGGNTLTFTYTPSAVQASSSDLAVTGFTLPAGVTVRDAAGNNVNGAGAAINPTGTLAVDATAPSITAAAGSSGTFGIGQEVTFTLTGSEALTVSGTPTLALSNGATATYSSGSGTGSLVFKYTVAAGQTDSGDVNVTAINGTIKDAAGNTVQALSVGTTGTTAVDATAPAATTTVGLVQDTGSSSSDGVTSNPALSGVATGHQAGDTIVIKDNGAVVGTAAIGAGGAWTFANAGASSASHSYTAAVADAAGNTGTAAATSPATTTVDTIAPGTTATIALTTDTGTAGDGVTAHPALVGTVSNGQAGVLVTILDNGVAVGTATTVAGGTWSFANASAAEGAHTYTAAVTDSAGNRGPVAATSPATVTVNRSGNDNLTAAATTAADLLVGGDGSDTLVGLDGNDTLWGDDTAGVATGDGNDTLSGGAGDDSLIGGGGNDVLTGGTGNDAMDGGAGNDTADYSASTSSVNLVYNAALAGGAGYVGADGTGAGTDTLRGVETIQGGSAADAIDATGSLGAALFGNAGADSLTGGNGSDSLDGGAENDTLTGAFGSDTLVGGDGNDSLDGGADNDSMTGGAGSDALVGGTGNDTLIGGSGDDVMSGGDGEDRIIVGGTGNDTLDGGAGNDTVVFAGNKAFYTVTSATDGGGQYFLVTDTRGFEGTTKIYGANFLEFGDQTDPVCFYPGTLVATPGGERAVETLAAGELVLTAEGEARPVRWLGRQTVSTRFGDPLRVLPVRIAAGALGEGLPRRDLLVSADHALLVDGALVQAGALVNGTTVRRERDVPEVFAYWHVELADHSLVLAEGVPAESFVDNVARMAFDNWAEHEAAAGPAPVAEMALPRAKAARQVPEATRRRLAARAAALLGEQTAAA